MTNYTTKTLSAIVTAVVLSVAVPGTASAFYCDKATQNLHKAASAADSAEQLLADVRAKVRSGEFGKGELRGAKQNYRAQMNRYRDAVREHEKYCR